MNLLGYQHHFLGKTQTETETQTEVINCLTHEPVWQSSNHMQKFPKLANHLDEPLLIEI